MKLYKKKVVVLRHKAGVHFCKSVTEKQLLSQGIYNAHLCNDLKLKFENILLSQYLNDSKSQQTSYTSKTASFAVKYKAVSQSKFDSPCFLGMKPEHKSVKIAKMLETQNSTESYIKCEEPLRYLQ
jgi:hypothetical protein